jgi:hypothetical protein
MNNPERDLAGVPTRRLLARRHALAAGLGSVEKVLSGSLVMQARRCGKAGCRCARGEPHGPYAWFTARQPGDGRMKYVPSGLVEVVQIYQQRDAEVQMALAEISAINAELLARRELE